MKLIRCFSVTSRTAFSAVQCEREFACIPIAAVHNNARVLYTSTS